MRGCDNASGDVIHIKFRETHRMKTHSTHSVSNLEQRIRDLQHFGEEGGVVPVIDLASTSTFLNPKDMEDTFKGEKEGCYLYSRHSNPTVAMFSQKMAALENTEAALGVASGMAAISCALEQLLSDGGEIISSSTVYGGTYALFQNIFPKQGIPVHFVDISDLTAVQKLINSKTKVIYCETMSNPLLRMAPIQELSRICKQNGIKLVIDNTFTPCLVTPADLGADVIVHSCTKYISGSSDMIAGVICGTQEFISSLIDVNFGRVMIKGPTMDPRTAHELYMRLDHLPVRMRAHGQMAQHFSNHLSEMGIPVIYPGHSSHPQFALTQKLFNAGFGYGGMMAIEMPTSEMAMQVSKALQDIKFGLYAVSLGFSRTLITVPAITTSSEIPAEEQKKMKLNAGLIRLSVGYTGDPDVMLARLKQVIVKYTR